MQADLKLRSKCGFISLAESTSGLPSFQSHHHRELELNLVVQGTITYVVDGNRFTFLPRTMFWLFPGKEHQLIARSDNVRSYVVVFTRLLINRACHISKYQDLEPLPGDLNELPSTVQDPRRFDLIAKMMESLMQGSLNADLLNRGAGFGPGSDFSFEHPDPDA